MMLRCCYRSPGGSSFRQRYRFTVRSAAAGNSISDKVQILVNSEY
jgi:hypothetical protein